MRNGKVTRYSQQEGLPSDTVQCLFSDRRGNVWVCTPNGLAELTREKIRVFGTEQGLTQSATCRPRASCRTARCTSEATARALATWDGTRFHSRQIGLPESATVETMLCSTDDVLWIGTSDGLIRVRGGREDRLTRADGLADDSILTLTASHDGSVLVGTKKGFSRIRGREIESFRPEDGLSQSTVYSLYEDREGSLWAATKHGLNQFFDGRAIPYTTREGLPSNNTGPVLQDSHGTIWVGTLGGGLARFDGHRFVALTTRDGLVSNSIDALAEDPAGDLWVGTDAGLNRLRDGQVTGTWTTQAGPAGRSASARCIAITAERSGSPRRTEPPRFVTAPCSRCRRSEPGLAEPILAFGEDRDARARRRAQERVAAAAPRGRALSRPRRLAVGGHARRRPAAHRRRPDRQLLGLRRPVRRRHLRHHRGRQRPPLDGLQQGHLLGQPVGSPRLRGRKNPQLRQHAVQPARRAAHDRMPAGCATRRHAGCGTAGCGSPPSADCWSSIPATSSDAIWRPRWRSKMSSSTAQRRRAADVGTLVAGRNNVEFGYTGVTLRRADADLLPLHAGGIQQDLGRRRTTTSGVLHQSAAGTLPVPGRGLQSGRRLRRGVARGRVHDRAALLPACLVLPRVRASALALGGWAIYQLRIRRLKEEFDLILAERGRIARELHDTLIQGFSGITMAMQALVWRLPSSEERKTLEDIVADAGSSLREARRSLAGLRRHDSQSGLAAAVADAARQLTEAKDVRLKLDLDDCRRPLPADVEYNLLRIAQEAVLNAVKHSGARTLQVTLDSTPQHLRLSVKDDGTGFDEEAAPPLGHYGLIGMKERAAQIGADFHLASARGRGTTVQVLVEA